MIMTGGFSAWRSSWRDMSCEPQDSLCLSRLVHVATSKEAHVLTRSTPTPCDRWHEPPSRLRIESTLRGVVPRGRL